MEVHSNPIIKRVVTFLPEVPRVKGDKVVYDCDGTVERGLLSHFLCPYSSTL